MDHRIQITSSAVNTSSHPFNNYEYNFYMIHDTHEVQKTGLLQG